MSAGGNTYGRGGAYGPMEDTHHIQCELEMGCGCRVEHRVGLDGDEPCGWETYTALLTFLLTPLVGELCLHDEHSDRGQETLTVRVRTKVGPVPREVPE